MVLVLADSQPCIRTEWIWPKFKLALEGAHLAGFTYSGGAANGHGSGGETNELFMTDNNAECNKSELIAAPGTKLYNSHEHIKYLYISDNQQFQQ